ncbi:MAG: hypothetical protein IJW73_04715 [Candidatus Gastranaerophilales bacterium]|nr:hypothetical protein [Candidatus Gastranaerophilales bacterium]
MKKLNIAFIWHFHQPNYQQNYDSDFLLPWVRLHASKDYLDMLKRIDNFSNIKLNFNFSPVLLVALQKYINGFQDLHLKLLLTNEYKLTEKDKIFILNNYFDLNYKNMALKRPYYTVLYNKRANAKELNTAMFNASEYADIMANYTLCWIDEYFVKDYPELAGLFAKERNYTLEDRNKIYEIQLDIIKRILVEYKNYQNQGKIEVMTSPYYHPILPLLIDFKGKEIKEFENLPDNFSNNTDAKEQVKLAIEKYEEIFDKKPKGVWLSEQCICSKTAELLSKQDIKWTVADEGVLSKTIKKEFVRDFEGNLESPYDLMTNYQTKAKHPLNLVFSDSFFANLLNFGYGNYDSKIAANDLYEKIKTIQFKLQNSPKENHILTIALDGENCWETYQNDGAEFLNALYSLIDEDESLETVLVGDFVENNPAEQLENLKSGSWINRNFDLWIGEPTKNIAWLYLDSVSKDIEIYYQEQIQELKDEKEIEELEKKFKLAHREILISQSSDWYWWYGKPNESKSDGIFDFLFRRHLMNAYEIIGLPIPNYLATPLANIANKPLRNPSDRICPKLTCDINDELREWENAGTIFIPDGPSSNISSLIKNIYFGNDEKYIYFRFELNRHSAKMMSEHIQNQIAIYFSSENERCLSPIRFVSKNDNAIYPILRNQFSREVRFVFDCNRISRIFFNKSCPYGLWSQMLSKNSKIAYKDVIEMKIPFEDLGFSECNFSFCIIDSTNELINEVYPHDVMITINE